MALWAIGMAAEACGHRTEIWDKIVKTPLKAVKMAHRDDSKNNLLEFL